MYIHVYVYTLYAHTFIYHKQKFIKLILYKIDAYKKCRNDMQYF